MGDVMDGKLGIHITAVALVLFILAAGNALGDTVQKKNVLHVSGFGFLAVLSLLFVFAIPLLFRFWRNALTAYLRSNIRWIGIYVFVFALIHIALVFHLFFGWDISYMLDGPGSVFLILGSLAFLILAAMAATSTDWAMRALGRNWKALHNLGFAALILVIAHSFNIGLVFMSQMAVAAAIILLGAYFVVQKIRHTRLI